MQTSSETEKTVKLSTAMTETESAESIEIEPPETQLFTEPSSAETEEAHATIETQPAAETEFAEDESKSIYLGQFLFTAYCPCSICCGEYASGYTATGTFATEGRTIAVDPNVIPWEWCFEIPNITWGLELGVFFIAPKGANHEEIKQHEHGHGIQNA